MYDFERSKRATHAYGLDDIAIVPSRRTRDPEEVSVAWQIDAYRFDLPIMAATMDSVMSPSSAIALGKLVVHPLVAAGVLALLPPLDPAMRVACIACASMPKTCAPPRSAKAQIWA